MPPQLPSKRIWRKWRKANHPDWPPTPRAAYSEDVRDLYRRRRVRIIGRK